MPRLTSADELFSHQIPEPLPNVAVHHEHWRESYFFVLHPQSGDGDVVILTMAHFPGRKELDSLQLGRVQGEFIYARHGRPYGDDPHTPAVGPVSIEIVEPFKTVHLRVTDSAEVPVALDLMFEARTSAYALRRGTMKRGDEIIWDQSHMIQAGTFNGSYSRDGVSYEVKNWRGQRDHSWGIRDHARCPFWMWLAIQLEDGMLGVWHWEYANGARLFTDGCFAPAGGGEPVPVIDFHHELNWTDSDGKPVSYARDGNEVRGLAGAVEFTLEGGEMVLVEGEGTWAIPYGSLGGGQQLMKVRTDDGRTGSAIYELTGAHHHLYFPVARGDDLPPE